MFIFNRMDNHYNTESIINNLQNKYGEETAARLLSYLDMVLERNQHINLTAVRDRDEAIVKHVLDSLAVVDLPEYKEAKKILDVGTGAGFPGALLAIVSPEKEFTLLDSTLKRLRVIDEFAEALDITNLKTIHARAEEISRKPGYSEAFDLCVSRAVADLDTLSKWCLPFVKKGGNFISYKGENYTEELERANKTIKRLGARVARVETYPSEQEEISGHVLVIISR